MYVYAPGNVSVQSFYSALRAGRSFATNGPMLTFTVDRHIPGDTAQVMRGRPLQVAADAQAREPIDRIELIANGRVVASTPRSMLVTEFEAKNFTWLAARCVLKTASTIRFAHTSPVYLSCEQQTWDRSGDKVYFLKWIDDLIAETEADPRRFATAGQRSEVLAVYRAAQENYR